MHPNKEYPIKIKKIIEKLEKALDKEKKKNGSLQNQNKYLNKRLVELTKSRDNWKSKLKVRKAENKNLKAQLERQGKAKGHQFDSNLVRLCIQLRIDAGCSYGSICKILLILNSDFGLGLLRLPCANSIQNWVSKMGLYRLKLSSLPVKVRVKRKVSLIIDESIRLGKEKLLLILLIPTEKLKKAALKFADVEVVYMEGATTWNGEKINEVIKEVIDTRKLDVSNILSDEDSKLKKASRLLGLAHLPDISHAIATCLKRTFSKETDYKAFTTLIASYQSKGVNQDLSYLSPPKQRAKARFMNQEKLVKWAVKMLEREDALSDKESLFFEELASHPKLIKSLADCLSLAKTISLPFKIDGLSNETLTKAREAIKKVDKRKKYLKPFVKEVEKYLSCYEKILSEQEEKTIQVSSEIIESMFGKYKSKANNHPLTGLTKLNLEIPLYGKLKETVPSSEIKKALEKHSISDLNDWIQCYSSENQLVRRMKFFKNEPQVSEVLN